MAFVLCLLVLTVIGAAGGTVLGLQLFAAVERAAAHKAPQTAEPSERLRTYQAANLKALPPIVTNLAGPGKTWVRLEASIVLDADAEGNPNELAARIAEDMLAYLRTTPLAQIEGAGGYQNLREDLKDRVRIRSGGKVRDLVLQALIVE